MRYFKERLRGDIGTIVGPKDITGEWLVIFDEQGSVGYATVPELQSAGKRIMRGDIRSVAEHRMREAQPDVQILKGLFNA